MTCEAAKIEKTFQTMLPSDRILQYQYYANNYQTTFQSTLPFDRILQHQYCAKNYQTYSDFVHDLLQAEKYDELTLRNHHQRSVGSAPLP
jgi:hypothetical protein